MSKSSAFGTRYVKGVHWTPKDEQLILSRFSSYCNSILKFQIGFNRVTFTTLQNCEYKEVLICRKLREIGLNWVNLRRLCLYNFLGLKSNFIPFCKFRLIISISACVGFSRGLNFQQFSTKWIFEPLSKFPFWEICLNFPS